jgi:pimeloyl-ACP methyl ester carboxylesterase
MLLLAGSSFRREDRMMKFAAARGNVRIAYDVLGSGSPVMMLHDFGQSSGFWYEAGCVKACVARGRQVVLVDLRGHGDSTEPVDATAYAPSHCAWDLIAVLDQAGIRRADIVGYGVGGRIALCLAALAPDRVHAVAAGGAHPFAERVRLSSDALAPGPESWVRLLEAKNATVCHNSAALSEAVVSDWPDIAEAVVRSRVPILFFVSKDDSRYPLVLSFAERSGAAILTLTEHDHGTTALGAGHKILPRVLDFFEAPQGDGAPERLPPCLWSGSWA